MDGRGEADASVGAGKGPRVHIPELTFEFGTMLNTETRRHDFLFTNTGNAPLKLEKGGSTCKCTVSLVDKAELAPNETAPVTLEWTPKTNRGPFRQTATILTNDPDRSRIVLTISGDVTKAMEVEPHEVVFSIIVDGESATQDVRLLCSLPSSPAIVGYKFSDPALAKYITVRDEPLPAKMLRGEVKGGHLLHIDVKPGLPLGAFQQTITVKTGGTNSPELPFIVRGTIVGDIGLAGRGWHEETSTLTLGAIRSNEQFDRTFLLIARGMNSKAIQFEKLDVHPDLLQVELGPTVAGEGRVAHTRLRIRIPQGTPPADYMSVDTAQSGQITLATHHSKTPVFKIHVRFAVRN
ncbi:MAG: DUF1573 domain-containing protein [Thermoguttaceae bacterium]